MFALYQLHLNLKMFHLILILLKGTSVESAGSVRLVNGASPCAGRVELYHDGQWGTVSGYYGWGMKEADVVCRELRCGAALSAPGTARYGKGSDLIVTFGISCRGNESALRECPSYRWGHYSWPHSYDAGVTCSGSLHKPIIYLKPDFRVFLGGESAEISCSGNYPGSKFSLYRVGKVIASQQVAADKIMVTFTLSNISAGNYWCRYTTHIERREATSPESERVRIYVTDPLQKPTISMKPDSRVFMRGELAEVSCSGNYPGSNFSLYRDGEFITSETATENNSMATFTALEISAGNYTCNYTTHIDGREFTSPASERVGISVLENWNWMLITGLAVGIVSAILTTVFSLIFCVYKRGKQNIPRGERNIPTASIPQSNDATYATARFAQHSVPAADTDIIYANLNLGNGVEKGWKVAEDDGTVYAAVRV